MLRLLRNGYLVNSEKTEVIMFGPDHLSGKLLLFIGPLASNITSPARKFRIIFDSQLNFTAHVNSLLKSYFHLGNIFKIKSALSFPDLEKLIHAFTAMHFFTCINQSILSVSASAIAEC